MAKILCRAKLGDQQQLAHGPPAKYPNEDFGDEVPCSGNALGGQPAGRSSAAPAGPTTTSM
jgi:formyl-CoA transferase